MLDSFLAALVAGFIVSPMAQALPAVHVETVNGYEVHFVDVGRGDTLGASYQINLGTLSESGRFMGRAHLLEHVMHNGSTAFPGKKAYDQLLKPLGVHTNAYTSNSRTMYYASGPDNEAQTLLKVFLAALGGLDWNQENFATERQVVINEVVSERMATDDEALRHMYHTLLLPANHPWAHAPLGDRASLNQLTINDLKDLYYNDYRPENIRVTIQGNFSDPQRFAQIRTWTREALAGANPEASRYRTHTPPTSLTRSPSLFADPQTPRESERRLYIQSNHLRAEMVLLEADLNAFQGRPEAFDAMVAYLNLDIPGTFLHRLKVDLGWIAGAGFYSEKIADKMHLTFGAGLTEEGQKHVQEINQLMYQALRAVQVQGPDPATLQMLRDAAKVSLEAGALSVPDFVQLYADFRADGRSMQTQLDSMQKVSPAEVAGVAQMFQPARALYTVMGPTVAEMQIDPVNQRAYKLEDNRAAIKAYSAIMAAAPSENFVPRLTPIALPVAVLYFGSRRLSQTPPQAFLSERVVMDLRTDLPDAAAAVNLHLAPSAAEDLVVADLVLSAFNERYSGELNYLHFKYRASPASGRMGNILSFTASGETAEAASALEWLLQKLSAFVPTRAELQRASQGYADAAVLAHTSAFSAQTAIWKMLGKIDPLYLTRMQSRDLVKKLNLDEVTATWQRLRQASDKEYIVVGPIGEAEVEKLKQAAQVLSPQTLPEAVAKSVWGRSNWPAAGSPVEPEILPFDGGGIVRAYRGPRIEDLQEYAAFTALASFLEGKIKGHNRDDLGLGYVHGAMLRRLDNLYSHLLLVGQTDSAERLDQTLDGWDHVLNELREGKYSDSEIRDSISDVLNTLAQDSTTARELLAGYSGGLSARHDAFSRPLLIAALEALQPADVRAVAAKYVLTPQASTVQVASSSCELLLK